MIVTTQTTTGPVILVGLAHTGKTPLRIALATDPDLDMTRHVEHWLGRRRRFKDLSRPEDRTRFLDELLKSDPLAALKADEELTSRFEHGPADFYQLLGAAHKTLAASRGKKRWGIQLGEGAAIADEVLASIPDAVVIHLVRHPACQLAFGPQDSLRLVWNAVKWRVSATRATEHAEVFGHRYRIVRYEDIAANPGEALSAISTVAGIRYRDAQEAAFTAHLPAKAQPPALSERRVRLVRFITARAAARIGYPIGADDGTWSRDTSTGLATGRAAREAHAERRKQ